MCVRSGLRCVGFGYPELRTITSAIGEWLNVNICMFPGRGALGDRCGIDMGIGTEGGAA